MIIPCHCMIVMFDHGFQPGKSLQNLHKSQWSFRKLFYKSMKIMKYNNCCDHEVAVLTTWYKSTSLLFSRDVKTNILRGVFCRLVATAVSLCWNHCEFIFGKYTSLDIFWYFSHFRAAFPIWSDKIKPCLALSYNVRLSCEFYAGIYFFDKNGNSFFFVLPTQFCCC